MTQTHRIKLIESDQPFEPAQDSTKVKWIQSSFTTDPDAIGELRFKPPSNGRYERKHLITTPEGNTHAYFGKADFEIGYTFAAIYANDRFWIANQTFSSTPRGDSAISLVGEKGTFLFGKDRKFAPIEVFGFDSACVNSIKAFRLIHDDKFLLYLNSHGFALFNVERREIEGKADFEELAFQSTGFDISPIVPTLAIAFSKHIGKNPIDAKDQYRNILRIYDMTTGAILADHALPTDDPHNWKVQFSSDGRQLEVKSPDRTIHYQLHAT